MDRGSVAVTIGFVEFVFVPESDSKFGGNVLGTMGRNSERPLGHGRMDLWAEAFIPPPFSSFLYEKPQHLKKKNPREEASGRRRRRLLRRSLPPKNRKVLCLPQDHSPYPLNPTQYFFYLLSKYFPQTERSHARAFLL
jgi:hypothetical protein